MTDEPFDLFADIFRRGFDDLLRQLLQQYLNREPIPEDGKLLTIGTNPNWDYYLVAIKGRQVGKIKYVNVFGKITFTFTPDNPL